MQEHLKQLITVQFLLSFANTTSLAKTKTDIDKICQHALVDFIVVTTEPLDVKVHLKRLITGYYVTKKEFLGKRFIIMVYYLPTSQITSALRSRPTE